MLISGGCALSAQIGRTSNARHMIRVTDTLRLDEAEISESFIRASGPGGQNVNKVASAVQLRFDVRGSPSLPQPVKTISSGCAPRSSAT